MRSTGQRGELLVAERLIGQGWSVAHPFGDNEPFDLMVNKETEKLARKHCKYSEKEWARDRADFQSQWERMLHKRERRFRWFIKHGSVRDGWTPPDPNDPHSRKYPKRALAARLPKKYRMFWPVLLDRSDCELMEDCG